MYPTPSFKNMWFFYFLFIVFHEIRSSKNQRYLQTPSPRGRGPNQSPSSGKYTFTRRRIIYYYYTGIGRLFPFAGGPSRRASSVFRPFLMYYLTDFDGQRRGGGPVTRSAIFPFVTGSNKSRKLSFTGNVTRLNTIDPRPSNDDNNRT